MLESYGVSHVRGSEGLIVIRQLESNVDILVEIEASPLCMKISVDRSTVKVRGVRGSLQDDEDMGVHILSSLGCQPQGRRVLL